MAEEVRPGSAVQTPLGKGVVRELRNNGRVLVDVGGRALVFRAHEIGLLDARDVPQNRSLAPELDPPAPDVDGSTAIDLHGLTVEQALTLVADALNDALLDHRSQLRFIHGRSGGRLRAALHRHLRDIPSVRGFRLDPRNAGVTIVEL